VFASDRDGNLEIYFDRYRLDQRAHD
jgi:hypothetical protein